MKELWLKKENAKVDCADDAVTIIDSSPLAIHAKEKISTYVFGPFVFFENFTKQEEE